MIQPSGQDYADLVALNHQVQDQRTQGRIYQTEKGHQGDCGTRGASHQMIDMALKATGPWGSSSRSGAAAQPQGGCHGRGDIAPSFR